MGSLVWFAVLFWLFGWSGQKTLVFLLAFARLSGLLLTLGILLQFFLMSRFPWLEGVFGLDKLSQTHQAIGKYLLFFIVAHPVLILLSYSSLSQITLFAQARHLLQFEDIPTAAIATLLLLGVVVYSILMVWRRWEFEKWYYAHLSVYIAVAFAFGHQIAMGGDFLAGRGFAFLWYGLYIFALTPLVLFRFLLPFYRFYKYRFIVERLVQETQDVWSVYIGGRSMEKFQFNAGQFVFVRFLCKGKWVESHPFSLSAPYNGKSIRLSIKASGDFTSTIGNLVVGTAVVVEGSYGLFTARKSLGQKVLLIAGGIGITPIRGVMEDLGKMGNDVVLFYANKTEADIALRTEVEALGVQYNFSVHYVLSGENSKSEIRNPKPVILNSQHLFNMHSGFITADLIREVVPDVASCEIFLCGPPPMMTAIEKVLLQLGVKKSNIYFEKFSL